MSDWIRSIIVAVCTVVGIYVGIAGDVRDHGHRIDRLERWSESHSDKHDAQLEKIDSRLSKIEINIARMAGDTDRNPMASSVMSRSGSK